MRTLASRRGIHNRTLAWVATYRNRPKILELSQDLPIVIEIVDASDRIEAFLPVLDGLVGEGLVTVEPARIILYRGPEHPRH